MCTGAEVCTGLGMRTAGWVICLSSEHQDYPNAWISPPPPLLLSKSNYASQHGIADAYTPYDMLLSCGIRQMRSSSLCPETHDSAD